MYDPARVRSKDQVRKDGMEGDGSRGGLAIPGRRGTDPQLRRRQAGRRAARRAPTLEARPDDQGEPGFAADARAADRAGGGQDADDGRAPAARRAPVPATRPEGAECAEQIREAATIKGALQHGRVVAEEELPEIDMVLCGSVAVNLTGARIGKGGGYSDLEYGLLIDGRPDRRPHDRRHDRAPDPDPARAPDDDRARPAVDLVATPRAAIEVERHTTGRAGSCGTTCSRPQIREIPILERMGYA